MCTVPFVFPCRDGILKNFRERGTVRKSISNPSKEDIIAMHLLQTKTQVLEKDFRGYLYKIFKSQLSRANNLVF